MAEELILATGTKTEQYEALYPQLKALITQSGGDLIANMANMAAALKQQFNWLWVGFYLVQGESLMVGPFQGPIACVRIDKGKGVCGQAWAQRKFFIVDDVREFPGHIACNSLSQSEIVLPIYKQGEVIAVLDVDSTHKAHFDNIDELWLTRFIELLTL